MPPLHRQHPPKAALLDALTKAGLPPGRASVLTQQHCQAQVTPGDLLIIDTAGEGRVTREIHIGTTGQIMLDLDCLLASTRHWPLNSHDNSQAGRFESGSGISRSQKEWPSKSTLHVVTWLTFTKVT